MKALDCNWKCINQIVPWWLRWYNVGIVASIGQLNIIVWLVHFDSYETLEDKARWELENCATNLLRKNCWQQSTKLLLKVHWSTISLNIQIIRKRHWHFWRNKDKFIYNIMLSICSKEHNTIGWTAKKKPIFSALYGHSVTFTSFTVRKIVHGCS